MRFSCPARTWRRPVALLLSAVLLAGAGARLSGQASALAALITDVARSREARHPLPLPAGADPRYRDRLPIVSEQLVDDQTRELSGFLERLGSIDRTALAPAEQVDADILERQLRHGLEENRFRTHLMPLGSRTGFHIGFAGLPDRRVLGSVADGDDYVAKLASFQEHTRQQIARLRLGIEAGLTTPREVLEGYDATIRPYLVDDERQSVFYRPLTSLPASIPAADRARLLTDGARAIRESVIPGYREFLQFITREYLPAARTTIGFSALPGGRELYQARIRWYTTLPLSPDEVHRIGQNEVTRIRGEMEAIRREVGFGGTLQAFIEALRTDPRFYVASPEQYLAAVALAAKRMDGQLPRLFADLPRTPYGIRAMPDAIAPRESAGYYDGGDPGRQGGFVNVNTSDLSHRPLYVTESLAFHEGVPGHHLQIMLARELPGVSDFRRDSGITAFVEGWALYAERLGREVGLSTDPYSRFGLAVYEIWRAVRLVVDTGMHALGWTRRQAIDFMMANTGFSGQQATAEVNRHVTEAGQGLAYTVGLLKIVELRREAERTLGARFDLRAFHSAVLGGGAVPLEQLERQVRAWVAARAASPPGAPESARQRER
jgi:uncharacterized protein (DUF885 family)